ncbi:hypothetical protein G7Y89_g4079 [Cudoniella acicularis]|uniref:Uncharacterized protein n=1 Tax=Cudoniella acicularis TaxID=354080 RepID=A0A8H4RQ62_9HELO|nr:hypothetical protein G7Y89_g4079 [Cudoniella acicularis]
MLVNPNKVIYLPTAMAVPAPHTSLKRKLPVNAPDRSAKAPKLDRLGQKIERLFNGITTPLENDAARSLFASYIRSQSYESGLIEKLEELLEDIEEARTRTVEPISGPEQSAKSSKLDRLGRKIERLFDSIAANLQDESTRSLFASYIRSQSYESGLIEKLEELIEDIEKARAARTIPAIVDTAGGLAEVTENARATRAVANPTPSVRAIEKANSTPTIFKSGPLVKASGAVEKGNAAPTTIEVFEEGKSTRCMANLMTSSKAIEKWRAVRTTSAVVHSDTAVEAPGNAIAIPTLANSLTSVEVIEKGIATPTVANSTTLNETIEKAKAAFTLANSTSAEVIEKARDPPTAANSITLVEAENKLAEFSNTIEVNRSPKHFSHLINFDTYLKPEVADDSANSYRQAHQGRLIGGRLMEIVQKDILSNVQPDDCFRTIFNALDLLKGMKQIGDMLLDQEIDQVVVEKTMLARVEKASRECLPLNRFIGLCLPRSTVLDFNQDLVQVRKLVAQRRYSAREKREWGPGFLMIPDYVIHERIEYHVSPKVTTHSSFQNRLNATKTLVCIGDCMLEAYKGPHGVDLKNDNSLENLLTDELLRIATLGTDDPKTPEAKPDFLSDVGFKLLHIRQWNGKYRIALSRTGPGGYRKKIAVIIKMQVFKSLPGLVVFAVSAIAFTPRLTMRADNSTGGSKTGFDLSGTPPASFWPCAVQKYQVVAISGYMQGCAVGGEVRPNFVANYHAAKAAGIERIDAYMFPCTGTQPTGVACKSITTQLNEFLAAIDDNGMKISHYWLDIEPSSPPCAAWNMGTTANAALARQWVAALGETGRNWGIYANANTWTDMFASKSTDIGSQLPLWAVQDDFQPGVDTVTRFMEGWTSAVGKQYNEGRFPQVTSIAAASDRESRNGLLWINN